MAQHTSAHKLALALVGFITIAGAACAANAAIIAQYNFTGPSASSSDTELNSAAGNVTDPAGNSVATGQTGFRRISTAQGNAAPGLAVTLNEASAALSEATAVSSNAYWTFTLTPTAGYELDLSSLSFDTKADVNGATFFVRANVPGDSTFATTYGNAYHNTNVWTNKSIALGSEFQNLTGATTFRLYTYKDTGYISTDAIRADNLIIEGSVVPVPEPASAVLAGLGSLALLARRRSSVTA